MFTSQGIQPVTVVFNNAKNCFLHLPSKLISHLSLNENQALELSWDVGSPVFLSWTLNRGACQDSHRVELCRQLGEKLGLNDGEQGFVRPCLQVSSLHQVFVEPVSSDDWEILELHSSTLEEQLLNQIRVVFRDAVLPVWVDRHTAIFIRIMSLSPFVPYGRLEQFTELVVSPKNRAEFDPLSDSPVRSVQKEYFHRQQNADSSTSPSEPTSRSSVISAGHQWGGIADLRSLFRYIIWGTYDAVPEPPPVPDIPTLFTDSIYRVCGVPPHSLCTISQVATSVIHLFPWNNSMNDGVSAGQAPLTYGLLSKVASPEKTRKKMKLETEAKKNMETSVRDAPADSEEKEKEEETVVVRTVCHGTQELSGLHRSKGEIYSGRVWIPQMLASRLNIPPHSAVRIKPVKTPVKMASSIRLQPLKPLPEEDDEEIQMAFLGWLHTQSHEPLACLTARSGTILLHATDAKLEFALTVLKPEPENDPADQLFLLAPTIFKKENIQVDRELVAQPDLKAVTETLNPELPSLCDLGGVDTLSQTGFEFISHTLLGSPLSRALGTAGRGLRGGALLITGAKGSGKSSLSRALCQKAREDLDAHVEVVDCKVLQGKRADAIRKILQSVFEQAEWMHPSVVLLDDLDLLARAPTSPEHEHGPEALLHLHVAQSLKDVVYEVVLHSSLVCLIVTSQSEQSLHSLLTEVPGSRFIQGFVNIEPPDRVQRADIMRHLILRKSCFSQETLQTLDLGAVAKETEGYTPLDLTLLLERATHANTLHRINDDHGVCLTWSDFAEAFKGFTPPSLWGIDFHIPSGFGLERVGGLKEVRQQLMDTVLLPAKYPILFANLPIRHRSGILLYGAPGTGKTLLARAVAKESGMNFISIKGPELLSKYIGASEQAVRDVFQRAQAAKPCILFFDEFDSLAPRRGHDSTGVTDRVVNQLLTQLDGVEGLQGVYVLAATSRPDLIDPALLRPGRLDKSLYCPPPNQEARVEILRALSLGVPLAPDVDLEQVAAATEHFTGADLKALLYNAQLEAVHNSLGSSTPNELASGSESDMSLSSMIFPTNSSGSDESVGDLEQSMVLLEHSELQTEDEQLHSNLWRLYFGSSFETESGNSPVLGLNSRCVSGPNSGNHDFTAAARDLTSSAPPAYMPSVQRGFEELSPEQLERLQEDVNTIKKNHKGVNKETVLVRSASSQRSLLLSQIHLNAAMAATKPSISQANWKTFTRMYENFGGFGDKKTHHVPFKPGQLATLA